MEHRWDSCFQSQKCSGVCSKPNIYLAKVVVLPVTRVLLAPFASFIVVRRRGRLEESFQKTRLGLPAETAVSVDCSAGDGGNREPHGYHIGKA
jgi:hypothetical protein